MRKLIAATLILVSNASMAWNVTNIQYSEFTKIQESIDSGKITLSQSTPLFISCYQKGNKLCGVALSSTYLALRDYPNEYKYANETKGVLIYPNGSKDAISDHLLADMYFYGRGVIQDYEKSIEHYKVCAFIGDKDCVFGVSESLKRKQQGSVESTAWAYVAVSLGFKNMRMLSTGNKCLLADYLSLDAGYHSPLFNTAVKTRAHQLCSIIPGCVR